MNTRNENKKSQDQMKARQKSGRMSRLKVKADNSLLLLLLLLLLENSLQ